MDFIFQKKRFGNSLSSLEAYVIGSQSGVRGPPGVLERVPGGPQLNDLSYTSSRLELVDKLFLVNWFGVDRGGAGYG